MDKSDAAGEAKKAYYEVHGLAEKCLKPTHPLRIGIGLNLSVFYFDIMEDVVYACQIAKDTFDCAISDLDNVDSDHYKETTLLMQLLRDNQTLWYKEMVDDNGVTKPQYANTNVA